MLRRSEVECLGRRREAEPGKIRCHAAELRPQTEDEMPVEKRPRRIPVQEQEDGSRSFVDVMHLRATDGHESTLERKEIVGNPVGSCHLLTAPMQSSLRNAHKS